MGTVFAATVEDDPSADPVAVKVIHPHLLGRSGFFKRFLREAAIGKPVRHENVVRTLDADAAAIDGDQYHFLVMEYVAGRTLRELHDELGVLPEALVREVARQTAAGLAAIHAAGAVHRDLKPENVLITDDQRVRIMDLGVARQMTDTTQLTMEGQFAGSVRYAAPEQFTSSPVTEAVDLYALGLMIYELVVGEHPFPADDTSRLIAAHLTEAPPRAVERSTEVSAFLSALIDVLLAKEAECRISSATALQDILVKGEDSDWWRQREVTALRNSARRPRVPVRRETAVMGREDEVALLSDAWERAKAGEGGVVLIEGETGIGKSRLLDSLLAGIDSAEAHVLYGSYAPSGGLGGLSDAIVSHFGATGLAAALRPHLDESPSLVPAFASMVRHETPPDGVDAPSLTALHSLYTQLQRGLAGERPLLWIVEDLHFADSFGLQLVLSLARSVEGRRVLMVLTGRPGLPPEEMSQLGRLPGFRRVLLPRLTEKDVVSLLRAALRSESLAERLGPSIHRKSDGVPFFVFELLRGLKEGDYLEETADGSYVESKSIREIEVPSAVRDLVGARLAEIGADQRSLLEAAAVQGFVFDTDVLADVTGQRLVRVLQDLARIERGTGVIQAAGRQYRFDHHQIQEVVYGGIHPRLREEYHTLTGDAFHGRAEGSGETAYRIATHHLRGSRPADANAQVLPAMKHLSRSHRHEAAAALSELALAVDGADRFAILMLRIKSLHELGRRTEEMEALTTARKLASPSERGQVLRAFGSYYLRTSSIAQARESVEEALALARKAGDREAEIDTLGQLAAILAHRGLYAEALEHNQARLAISREVGDRRREAASADSTGEMLAGLGRNEEARKHAELAVGLSRELGARRMEAGAIGNLATLLRSTGDFEEALELGERYLELTREVGHREGIAIGTGNLARTLTSLGEYGKAEEQLRRAAALCRELGNRYTEGMYLGMLGSLRMDMGDLDGSRESLELARELFEEVGDRRLVGYCIRELGEIAAVAEDFALAARLYDQAAAEFADQPFLPGEVGLRLSRARLAANRGQDSAAEMFKLAAEGHRGLEEHTAWIEATAWLATLHPDTLPEARSLYETHRRRVSALGRVHIPWLLYRAGGEKSDLREAQEALQYLVERIPGPAGKWIVTRVPIHREIMAAQTE